MTAVPDDYELLARWRGGEQSAGDALVRRHYGSVLRFFEVRTRVDSLLGRLDELSA